MSKLKIRHQNDAKRVKEQEQLLDDMQKDMIDMDGLEKVLQEDPNIFLLNNLMMAVQFFESYERDVRRLRENWFKELSIDCHHKKCFRADSLFRLSGNNIKFARRHGEYKNLEFPLHPFRTYVTSDNIEAAFDPSALGRNTLKVWPEYQFTIRTEEKTEKAGCVALVEFKIIHEPNKSQRGAYPFEPNAPNQRHSIYIQKKPSLDEKATRRLTKTELSIGFLNKNLNPKVYGKRCSVRFPTVDGTIPVNGFYKFENPKARLKRQMIYDLRMNLTPETSHEIPQMCFQYEEVRINLRRANMNQCFKIQRVLNSAAFKGYFCDLLIENLAEPLKLDSDAVSESTIIEEFIIVNQNGAQHYITPSIIVRDCKNFVAMNRFRHEEKPEELPWPSRYMQRIMKILPCEAVPTCHSSPLMENLDYEKSWKLVFPKSEEFLLLHMMHSHIRCYFFVLLIYKSFIEPEINGASLGPKHLMHLLFWKVHKNFLAWPEDRPAETFIDYLKTLYKKLQNKNLPDFFIPSRNLFATSFQKDLHMAQSLVKLIIENPVPYLIRAVSQLNLRHDFYPAFDCSELNKILTEPPVHEKIKREVKKEKPKQVRFQVDEEQLWKKTIIEQIEREKKAEKQEEIARQSIESVKVDEILNFDPDNWDKCTKILQIFASHFLQMGSKSIEYNFLSQGLMYLNQTQTLLQLLAARELRQENLNEIQEQINQLKQSCYGKIKQELRKLPGKPKQFLSPSQTENTDLENSETLEQGKETDTTQEMTEENNENNQEDVSTKL